MNKYALAVPSLYIQPQLGKICSAVFLLYVTKVYCWTASCERQTHKMKKAFFKAILRQEIGWFDKHGSGELTTRLAE